MHRLFIMQCTCNVFLWSIKPNINFGTDITQDCCHLQITKYSTSVHNASGACKRGCYFSVDLGFNAKIESIKTGHANREIVDPNTAVRTVMWIHNRTRKYFGNGHLHCGHVVRAIVNPAYNILDKTVMRWPMSRYVTTLHVLHRLNARYQSFLSPCFIKQKIFLINKILSHNKLMYRRWSNCRPKRIYINLNKKDIRSILILASAFNSLLISYYS